MENQKKYIVVVGGSGKLGQVVSAVLLEQEYGIILMGRNTVKLEEVHSHLGLGGDIHCVPVDLTNIASVRSACKRLAGLGVVLRGMVNCAAGFYRGPFAAMTDDMVTQLLYANFAGVVLLIKCLLPEMRTPIDIINITSLGSATTLDASRSSALHITSKAALEIFDSVLGRELAKEGIRVTTVAPGTFAKPGVPGIPLVDIALVVRMLFDLPQSLRVETVALFPNGID
jgi:NAD(P)-dependent dehydrogenase (short-subunit alcohol dehydrogenase family)